MTITRNGVWLALLTGTTGLIWPLLGRPLAGVLAVAGVLLLVSALVAHLVVAATGWARTGRLVLIAGPATVTRGDLVTLRVEARGRPTRARARVRVTGLGVDREFTVRRRAGQADPGIQASAPQRGRRTVHTGAPYWSDPLDLFRQRVGEPVATQVTVLPRFARFRLNQSNQDAELGMAERSADLTGLFAGLRGYVPGDDIRLIQWAASARTADGSVLVRQDAQPQGPSLALVLDTAGWPAGGTAFETAVDIVYSLLRSAGENGYALSLTYAAGHDVARATGLPAIRGVLLELAAQPVSGPVIGLTDVLARRAAGDPRSVGPTVAITCGSGVPDRGLLRTLRAPTVLVQVLPAAGGTDAAPAGVVRRAAVPVLTVPDLQTAARLWATVR